MARTRPAICPFLIPVTADHLWLYPTGVYCHPPGRRVRMPARATLVRLCLGPEYVRCAGYRDGVRARARERTTP